MIHVSMIDHVYIFSTVILTVYSQLIMRWQVGLAGPLPPGIGEKVTFVAVLLLNPWILTGIVATFFAGVSWMLAMTRFEISYAFPFMSLNYVIVLAAGIFLFGEEFSGVKLVGASLVVLGLIVLAKG